MLKLLNISPERVHLRLTSTTPRNSSRSTKVVASTRKEVEATTTLEVVNICEDQSVALVMWHFCASCDGNDSTSHLPTVDMHDGRVVHMKQVDIKCVHPTNDLPLLLFSCALLPPVHNVEHLLRCVMNLIRRGGPRCSPR